MIKNIFLKTAGNNVIRHNQFSKLLASDGAASDKFGYSVTISDDGGYAVVGAYNKGSGAGSAYIYTKQENGQYTQTQKLTASDGAASDYFGWAASISGDGGSIVIGAYNKGGARGSAYIFTRQENGQYTQTQKLLASDGAASDRFGISVAISGDGGAVVGEEGDDNSRGPAPSRAHKKPQ